MKAGKSISVIFALLAIALAACGGGGQQNAGGAANLMVQTAQGTVVGARWMVR